MQLGAVHLGERRCRFLVWAPSAQRVQARLMGARDRYVALDRDELGYHSAAVDAVDPGTLYLYRLDDRVERPDPASRSQPRGVHGPSEVVDPSFAWSDAGWSAPPLERQIFYELHVGAYTPEGTFDAIVPRLDGLRELGVTTLQLMPVAQFPGTRNWGYDGAYPFAVQCSYGGPAGLKRLVDACHRRGLAVSLDVVYNHFGPEGCYVRDFGPYFTDRYRTPWGDAINFDGPHSDEVRRFFIENARRWFEEFHVDALRLDALHAIFDASARPFLEELAASAPGPLIAETNRNDSRFIRPAGQGGMGLHAQWNDDFHHSLRTLLTGERSGYYRDYGTLSHLARAFSEGYAYSGQYSPYRRRRHGNSPRGLAAHQFVVFSQNHDQVGNRARGDRLGATLPLDALKLAAGAVLLSPFVPLLFMGEEYGETAPFAYFVSHSDPALIEAVRRGRREEFADFAWPGEVPDPQDEATFRRSRLDPSRGDPALREFYRTIIALRTGVPALARLSFDHMTLIMCEEQRVLALRRWSGPSTACVLFNFGDRAAGVDLPPGRWRRRLDSREATPVSEPASGRVAVAPLSFVLFEGE